MTRTKHDQFAKELLSGLLETVGIPRTEVKVTSEIRGIDLLFVPLSEKAAERKKLGLLGRIAATACLIEPNRNPPAHPEIRNCQMRLFIQHGEHLREAKRNKQKLREADYEMLWVVGPTISKAILADFKADSSEDWGKGVYFLGVGEHTALVAVHQLKTTRDTLWLRILGRGKIQKKAIDEVLALPKDDPLRNLALELITSWQIRTEKQADLSPEDQEIIMNVSSAYAEWKQQTLLEGELRGRELGQHEGELRGQRGILLKQMTRKFGSLSAQVVSQVQAIDSTEKLEQLAEALIDAPDLQTFLQNL
jgi:Domain of unknown function (DUF4351)